MVRSETSVTASRRAEREKLLRELQSAMASKRTSKAKGLRKDVSSLKKERGEQLKDARKRCASNKKKSRAEAQREHREARERDQRLHQEEREAFRAEQKKRRLERRTTRLKAKEEKIQAALAECQRERQAIEQEKGALIEDREGKLKAQLEDIRVYRAIERQNVAQRKDQRRARASAKERRSESDDEVLQNIDRSLHPLFHRLKRSIRGNARMSRTEAFLQYVHDHPEEAVAQDATYTDKHLAREYARYLAQQRAAPALEAARTEDAAPPSEPPTVRKSVRKGGRRRAKQDAEPAAVAPAALRSLSAASRGPRAMAPAPPAPAPAPQDEEIITIRGVRAQPLRSPGSPELEEMMERAAIQGGSWMAWKVGELEILRRNGHLYIARPGAPLVTLEVPPDMTSRAAVELWLEKEQLRRPFSDACAPREGLALPEATAGLPAGVQIEERDGVVRVLFPERPRVESRERLKRARFRWNPPAWEARATDEARAVAAEVAREAGQAAPVLTAYEDKRLARVERMKTRAVRAKQEAETTIGRAREMAAVIPFGEPIHVGHHSETRDRRYRAKIHRTYDKGFRMLGEAEALERRAAGAEQNTAISSDDPNAIEKLEAKLAELERVRALLPQARTILKKARSPEAARAELVALGLDEWGAARLTPGPPLQRWAGGTVKRNLDGEIQRVRRRIADLQARATRTPPRPEALGDARIVEGDNRVRIFFPGKPDEATRKALRSRGFLWAPSVGAWQRKATESAWFWAREILRKRAPSAPAPASTAPMLVTAELEPPVAQFDDEPPRPREEELRGVGAAGGAHVGTAWNPERQVSMFGTPVPAASPAAPLVLAPVAGHSEQPRRSVPRTPPKPQGPQVPRRNLAFEDLNPWEMSTWERTPSLFGEGGPVPPPQPGDERAPRQKRLRF